MSQRDKQEAAEKLGRAGRQARHAASNVGDAAEAVTEHARDEIVEHAEQAKTTLTSLAKQAVTTERGRSVLAMSIGLISAGVGIKKFRDATRLSEGFRSVAIEEQP